MAIHYYCIYCDKEVYWDDESKGNRCPECEKFLTEDEITMLDDDVDDWENHL